MKSILDKVAGIVITATFVLGMFSCSSDTDFHEHTFSKTYISDEIHHWYAATCEHKEQVKDKTEHTFGGWTVVIQPTEKAEGIKERECSVCHYKAEEKVAKLDHVHTFATAYSSNEIHHWYAATCEHKEQVKDKTEHAFGGWTVVIQPTEKAEGIKERECSVCHYKAEEKVAKLDHVHTFATAYSSNEAHHWYAATCEHKEQVKDKTEHTFGGWAVVIQPTEKAEGIKERECSVCHYKAEEKVAKLDHVHTFATAYSSNEAHHWYAATCEHKEQVKDKTEHTFGGWISNNDATKEADGTKYRICPVCLCKETVTDEGTKLPDYSKCAVGDFILKNGTILSKDKIPTSGTVAAVIVRAASGDKGALGVGIVHSTSGLAWCEKNALGCNIKIASLQGDKTSGYMDGSDGWKKLKVVCSDAEEHPEYYPAWNYSLTYASTNGLDGDLAEGWYLPTIAELYTIYKNKTIVNTSLSKAGGSQFGNVYYWSCCQYPSYDNIACGLYFYEGSGNYDGKWYTDRYVCTVRVFN